MLSNIRSAYLICMFALSIGAAIMVSALIITLGFLLPTVQPLNPTSADRYVNIFGSRIRYRVVDRGGPSVILLHGFGESMNKWEALKRHLTCGRVISLDIIGFGGSERPRIKYNLETHRRYLIAFMDDLRVEQAVFVGSSMGASIAAWTAAFSPERVTALVLAAPSGYPGSMWHRWPAGMFYKPGMLNRLAYTVVDTSFFGKLFPDSMGRQALDVTSSYNSMFADALSCIYQPVTLLWSRGDRRVPFYYSRMYLERISHAKLIVKPSIAGHDVAIFNPRDTAERICRMLGQIN